MGWGEPLRPVLPCRCEGRLRAERAEDLVASAVADRAQLEAENGRLRAALAQALRRDNFGSYLLGWWVDDVNHAERCDCDLEEEVLGDGCAKASGARPALLQDQGGFAPSLLMNLPPLTGPDDQGRWAPVWVADHG